MQTRFPIQVEEPQRDGRTVVVSVTYGPERPSTERHEFTNMRRARKFFCETEAEIRRFSN